MNKNLNRSNKPIDQTTQSHVLDEFLDYYLDNIPRCCLKINFGSLLTEQENEIITKWREYVSEHIAFISI